jgi:hypothetical protein
MNVWRQTLCFSFDCDLRRIKRKDYKSLESFELMKNISRMFLMLVKSKMIEHSLNKEDGLKEQIVYYFEKMSCAFKESIKVLK